RGHAGLHRAEIAQPAARGGSRKPAPGSTDPAEAPRVGWLPARARLGRPEAPTSRLPSSRLLGDSAPPSLAVRPEVRDGPAVPAAHRGGWHGAPRSRRLPAREARSGAPARARHT